MILFLYNQGAGDHVVQGLLLFREGGHDVADHQDDARDELGKVPACSSAKRNSLVVQSRNLDADGHFANRGLMLGAFQQGVIEPGNNQA